MADEREPLALALIVCDNIHNDPGSGKKTLLGLFSTVAGPEFPITLGALCVHVALTDCLGKTKLMVKLVDVNEEREPVFTSTGDVDCDDPLAVLDFAFYFTGVVFPSPGEYRLQLYASGTPIIERRLMAMQIRPHKLDGRTDHE